MKIGIESNVLKSLFKNVYFITGTAYAGKSTMVKLLSQKHGGICCGENYHDLLTYAVSPERQPNLCYFQTMSGWQEFLGRAPEEYERWIYDCAWEAAELEMIQLIRLSAQTDKLIFVDTNIPLDILHEISDYQHVAVMLSAQSTSVERFFERPDPEKQFLLRQINESPAPQALMANFKACIARINSPEHYAEYANSGFWVRVRDDNATLEQTLGALERHFGI